MDKEVIKYKILISKNKKLYSTNKSLVCCISSLVHRYNTKEENTAKIGGFVVFGSLKEAKKHCWHYRYDGGKIYKVACRKKIDKPNFHFPETIINDDQLKDIWKYKEMPIKGYWPNGTEFYKHLRFIERIA